jgi:hypothetical protein
VTLFTAYPTRRLTNQPATAHAQTTSRQLRRDRTQRCASCTGMRMTNRDTERIRRVGAG